MLLPCWDGVPPPPAELERAAQFATSARSSGDVLVHCAHGRGRSTTVMCACLVRAGLHRNWEEAFDAIRKKRRVVKLNRSMRSVLTSWQAQYVDGPPATKAPDGLEHMSTHGVLRLWRRALKSIERLRPKHNKLPIHVEPKGE